jgi:hypothetical protein
VKELLRVAPHRRLFLWWRGAKEALRHTLSRKSFMINDDAAADLSPKADQPKDEGSRLLFSWPPDCLWPFVDHESGNDS